MKYLRLCLVENKLLVAQYGELIFLVNEDNIYSTIASVEGTKRGQ